MVEDDFKWLDKSMNDLKEIFMNRHNEVVVGQSLYDIYFGFLGSELDDVEHVELVFRTAYGLVHNDLKPLGELILSGKPLPKHLRNEVHKMINGLHASNARITIEQDGEYRNSPQAKRNREFRDWHIRGTYKHEVSKNEKLKKVIRGELADKWNLKDATVEGIIKKGD